MAERRTDRMPVRVDKDAEIARADRYGKKQISTDDAPEMEGYLGVDDLDRLRRLRLGKQTNGGRDQR